MAATPILGRLRSMGLGPIGVEKPAVVLEIGSAYTKCGFAGEGAPRHVIPSTIVRKGESVPVFTPERLGDSDSIKEILTDFLFEIFYKYLLVKTTERRVLVVESPLTPTKFRQALADVLFRHFKVPCGYYLRLFAGYFCALLPNPTAGASAPCCPLRSCCRLWISGDERCRHCQQHGHHVHMAVCPACWEGHPRVRPRSPSHARKIRSLLPADQKALPNSAIEDIMVGSVLFSSPLPFLEPLPFPWLLLF
jgi:hypothetical protein